MKRSLGTWLGIGQIALGITLCAILFAYLPRDSESHSGSNQKIGLSMFLLMGGVGLVVLGIRKVYFSVTGKRDPLTDNKIDHDK